MAAGCVYGSTPMCLLYLWKEPRHLCEIMIKSGVKWFGRTLPYSCLIISMTVSLMREVNCEV